MNSITEPNLYTGEFPRQGERKDLAECVKMLSTGSTWEQIIEKYPGTGVRYGRHIEFVVNKLLKPPPQREKMVILIIGKTGIGKTRWVFDHYENPYVPICEYGSTAWWENYDKNEVVVLNEFTGQWSIEYLLNVTDRYPTFQVQVKTRSSYLWYHTIFITSNKEVDEWWPGSKAVTDAQREALKRRIIHTYRLEEGDRLPDAPFDYYEDDPRPPYIKPKPMRGRPAEKNKPMGTRRGAVHSFPQLPLCDKCARHHFPGPCPPLLDEEELSSQHALAEEIFSPVPAAPSASGGQLYLINNPEDYIPNRPADEGRDEGAPPL